MSDVAERSWSYAARMAMALSLLALLLPWLASADGLTAAETGLQILTRNWDVTVADAPRPSIPLILSVSLIAGCLVYSFVGSRIRSAAISLVGLAIAAIIIVLAMVFGFAKTNAPAIGFWASTTMLAVAILCSHLIAAERWREELPEGIRPYVEREPLAAFFLGISSGFPYAMIGATLTSRLAQDGIDKATITAFTMGFLVYNLKPLWAWVVDGVHIPLLGRLGQRVSWLILSGVLVIVAVANLALVDPASNIGATIAAAIFVGFAGATYDIVIDAYRIETLKPYQLGVGSGMTQYGWRMGSVAAGALALVLAARIGWTGAYLVCAMFALPAMITGLVLGEPERRREPTTRRGIGEMFASIVGPFLEFFRRNGAIVVLIFILIHKIGDTLGQIVLRLLLNDLGFSNDEIAFYDVGIGFFAYLIGIFIGGAMYARLGMKRSVLISLILMAVSNASFALLAGAGHSNWGLAGAIGFENIASGIGGVTVIAYFAALCDLRFTAAQYALISAGASVVGRLLTATTAGALVERFGYVNFYWLTTIVALPGVLLFWWMIRTGLVDSSIGDAGTEEASEPPAA